MHDSIRSGVSVIGDSNEVALVHVEAPPPCVQLTAIN